MKKLILAGCILALAGTNLFATPAENENLKLVGKLDDLQVREKVIKNERLPVYINFDGNLNGTFEVPGSKAATLKFVKEAIKEHNDYTAYHNAAVIAFTQKSPETTLTATDLSNIISWSTKALELNKGKQTPDMYLLRAIARYQQQGYLMQGLHPKEAPVEFISSHKDAFRPIAEDLAKVYEINPLLGTNYAKQLANIYEGLGEQSKAENFNRIYKQEQQLKDKEQKELQRRNQQQLTKEVRKDTHPRNTNSHPRSDANGVIWPNK